MPLDLGTIFSSIEVRTGGIKKGGDEAARMLDQLAVKVANKTKEIGGAIESVGRTLSISLAAPIAALGVASFKTAATMDGLKRGLVAVAGSSQEAEKQLTRLKRVAELPGLGMEEAIRGSIRLQAAGLSAKLAEKSLQSFGNALATVGGGKAELDGVTLALSQISAKGKVFAEEINQINERVPQIRKIMELAFGTSDTERIQKMGLTSTQFIEKVTDQLAKLPQVTGGVQNALENFGDSAKRALTAVGDSILPIATNLLNKVTPAIDEVGKRFRELPNNVKEFVLGSAGVVAISSLAVLAIGKITSAVGELKLAFLALATPIKALSGLIENSGLLRLLPILTNPAALTAGLLVGGAGPAGRGGDLNLTQRFPDPKKRAEYIEKLQREAEKSYDDAVSRLSKLGSKPSGPSKRTGIAGLDETLDAMFGAGDGNRPGDSANREELEALVKSIKDGMAARQKVLDDLWASISKVTVATAKPGKVIDARATSDAEIELLQLSRRAKDRERAAILTADKEYMKAVNQDGVEQSVAFKVRQAKINQAHDVYTKEVQQAVEKIQKSHQAAMDMVSKGRKAAGSLMLAGVGAVADLTTVSDASRKSAGQVDTSFLSWISPELGRVLDMDAADKAAKRMSDFVDGQFVLVDRKRALMREQDALMQEGKQKNADRIGGGMLDSFGNAAVGIANTARGAVRTAENIADRVRRAARQHLDFGEELGIMLADKFGNAFGRGTERHFRQIGRNIEGVFENLFENILSGQKNFLQAFLDDFKRMVIRLIAQIAASKVMELLTRLFGGKAAMDGGAGGAGGAGGGAKGSFSAGLGAAGAGIGFLAGGPAGAAIGGAAGSIFAAAGSIFGFADGGRPPVGRFSLVGERGPELVKFDRGATVFPSGTMPTGVDEMGGGGINIHGPVHIHGVTDIPSLSRALGIHIKRTLPYR